MEERPIKRPRTLRGNPLTYEQMRQRAETYTVPDAFKKRYIGFTPEHKLLLSNMRQRSIASRFRRDYAHFIQLDLEDQFNEASFQEGGVRFEFYNVSFGYPTFEGRPLLPFYARTDPSATYSAPCTVTMRFRTNAGIDREIEIDMGPVPVMMRSLLCNLHEANIPLKRVPASIRRGADSIDVLRKYSDGDISLADARMVINENCRHYFNEGYEDINYFIVRGVEVMCISLDVQALQRFQCKIDKKGHMTMILVGVRTNATSSVSVFFPPPSNKPVLQTVRLYFTNFMLARQQDAHINVFVPFVLAGWSVKRIREELALFAPSDHLQMVLNALEMTFVELHELVHLDGNGGGTDTDTGLPLSVLNYVYANMRDRGKNQLTGRLYTTRQVVQLFFRYLFRHTEHLHLIQDNEQVRTNKLRLLLAMVTRYILHHRRVLPPMDRDRWSVKKFCTIVQNMRTLASAHIRDAMRVLRRYIRNNKTFNIANVDLAQMAQDLSNDMNWTKTFHSSMTPSRNWGVQLGQNKHSSTNEAFCSKLKREAPVSTAAHQTRTGTAINSNNRGSIARRLPPSALKAVCPMDTPSGAQVGVMEHTPVCSVESYPVNDCYLLYQLVGHYVATPTNISFVELWVNGSFLGWCREDLEQRFRKRKQNGIIHRMTHIVLSEEPTARLDFSTVEGFSFCPMLVINQETGNVLADEVAPGVTNFNYLEHMGCIEYVSFAESETMQHTWNRAHIKERTEMLAEERRVSDARLRELYAATRSESANTMRALVNYRDYRAKHQLILRYCRLTHVDIDPSVILGVAANISSGIQHNSATRGSFAATQMRATIPVSVYGQMSFHVTQRKLVNGGPTAYNTVLSHLMGLDQTHTSSTHMRVAVMTGPWTQEDAVLVSSRFVEMGGGSFTLEHRREITTRKEKEPLENALRYGVPPHARHYKRYRNINPWTGMPIVGRFIDEDEVLVARTNKHGESEDVVLSFGEAGVIESTHVLRNSDVGRAWVIICNANNKLEEGSKVTTVHGQKSIVGKVLPELDMPHLFGADVEGHIDIVCGPTPQAARGTVSSLSDFLYSPVFTHTGIRVNGTAFATQHRSFFERIMVSAGLVSSGMRRILLPDGTVNNGEIFVGETSYYALAHISSEKITARGKTGPNDPLTGQPVQGLREGGGQAFGEQECVQSLVAGAVGQLVVRMKRNSDERIHIHCRTCHSRHFGAAFDQWRCRHCLGKEFMNVSVPYMTTYIDNVCSMANLTVEHDFMVNEA